MRRSFSTYAALVILAGAAWGTLAACTQTATPGTPTAASIPSSVSFKSDVAPLLAQNCASCHSATGRAARDAVFIDSTGQADYTETKADLGRIVSSVESGKMPDNASPLSSAEIGLLVGWQQQGAPNN